MFLIQKISSTLKTWVFKKKLLKFSDHFEQGPLACFYCPEMCRFSCGVAETTKNDALTPRGKMSILHLLERGMSSEEVAGSKKNLLGVLEQCTSCGRCSEYCVYDIDVADRLRVARGSFQQQPAVVIDSLEEIKKHWESLKGRDVFFQAPGRASFWQSHRNDFFQQNRLSGVWQLEEFPIDVKAWLWGEISDQAFESLKKSVLALGAILVESPETAHFLVQVFGPKIQPKIKLLWNELYRFTRNLEWTPGVLLHESSFYQNRLTRQGLSVIQHRAGFVSLLHGESVMNCGGEGPYRDHYPQVASEMAMKYIQEMIWERPGLTKIICQSWSCCDHFLSARNESTWGGTFPEIEYWLDSLVSYFQENEGAST